MTTGGTHSGTEFISPFVGESVGAVGVAVVGVPVVGAAVVGVAVVGEDVAIF